jgi:hypothetical protein
MIDIKPTGFIIRKYEKEDNNYENRSPYDSIMHVVCITEKICYIYGANGQFLKDDYKEVLYALLNKGFETLLIERHGKMKELNLKDIRDKFLMREK